MYDGAKLFKWYYDENRTSPTMKVILKHEQVDCMRRKLLFTIFKYLFSFRDIPVFKIGKLAKWWRHTLN